MTRTAPTLDRRRDVAAVDRTTPTGTSPPLNIRLVVKSLRSSGVSPGLAAAVSVVPAVAPGCNATDATLPSTIHPAPGDRVSRFTVVILWEPLSQRRAPSGNAGSVVCPEGGGTWSDSRRVCAAIDRRPGLFFGTTHSHCAPARYVSERNVVTVTVTGRWKDQPVGLHLRCASSQMRAWVRALNLDGRNGRGTGLHNPASSWNLPANSAL